MKFSGFSIHNYRSIGENGVLLNPIKKCTILVGKNNSGKSNILRAIKKVSDSFNGISNSITELDFHNRNSNVPVICRLFFALEESNGVDRYLLSEGYSSLWADYRFSGSGWEYENNIFSEIDDGQQALRVMKKVFNNRWDVIPMREDIKREFKKVGGEFFTGYSQPIPRVQIIPEFRKIENAEKYSFDGKNLVSLLAEYQNPEIGKDLNREHFENLQKFIQSILHLPDATIEVTRANPTIIINNGSVRLPLSSYGTGVHEAIILILAALQIRDSICCIEEPEIHFHPTLQRELLHFLINSTTNSYVLSTHSHAIINTNEPDDVVDVIHVEKKGNVTTAKPIVALSESRRILDDLGYHPSDLLQTNCLIWVEGPSDRIYLTRWLSLVAPELVEDKDFSFIYSAQQPKLEIEKSGGSKLTTNVLAINRNSILIFDRDDGKDQIRKVLIQQVNQQGGLGLFTHGKTIEHYIPWVVLERFFQKQYKKKKVSEYPFTLNNRENFGPQLDVFLVKNGHKKLEYDRQKYGLSKAITCFFEKSDITGDLNIFVTEIAEKIKGYN